MAAPLLRLSRCVRRPPGPLGSVVVLQPRLVRAASSTPSSFSTPPSSTTTTSSATTSTPRYATKKVWPPDFSRLSPQEQLRFEKRFKRRVALRSERPRWVKFVKLAQLFSVTFVAIYCVLFLEWDYGPQPFDGVRAWFWDTLGLLKGGSPRSAVSSPPSSPSSGPADAPAAASSSSSTPRGAA